VIEEKFAALAVQEVNSFLPYDNGMLC
jgi:hypothetical protein